MTSRFPVASIITCVRDQEPVLFQEAAASVARLGTAVEWIVIDDGSDCRHQRLQQGIASSVRDARYVSLPKNLGLSAARNYGLGLASGDWILVLDSDDQLEAGVINHLSALPDSVYVLSMAAEYFGQPGRLAERRGVTRYQQLFCDYGLSMLDPFLWFDFYYHGIFARRDLMNAVGGYRDDLRVGEDQDVLLRCIERAGRSGVAFVDEVGYRYRWNPRGVCATQWAGVEAGYCESMLGGALRRGASFKGCRHAGAIELDGALVDRYEYQLPSGIWIDFDRCRLNFRNS